MAWVIANWFQPIVHTNCCKNEDEDEVNNIFPGNKLNHKVKWTLSTWEREGVCFETFFIFIDKSNYTLWSSLVVNKIQNAKENNWCEKVKKTNEVGQISTKSNLKASSTCCKCNCKTPGNLNSHLVNFNIQLYHLTVDKCVSFCLLHLMVSHLNFLSIFSFPVKLLFMVICFLHSYKGWDKLNSRQNKLITINFNGSLVWVYLISERKGEREREDE